MQTLAQLRSGALAGATRLDLPSCGLGEFPREIFDLADTLEILNLNGNALRDLPDDLGRLHRLRILFGSENAFEHLPPSLGGCPRLEMVGFRNNRIASLPAEALPPLLRWLILTGNRLRALPDAIGGCNLLQKLMLSGNRLAVLPEELAQCERLELLRIAANELPALPPWVDRLTLSYTLFVNEPATAAARAAADGPAS